ncbi:MAG TPA: hypothetical protein VHI31_05210 [Actinomycetota bacterium]|nr:hypothetical protein [Actinomycetota bacterium]
MNDSGLPDYVDDLFRYLVRSNMAIRMAQVVFFICGLILPVMMLMILPNENGETVLDTYIPLFVIGTIFAACLFWYLGWLEVRRHRFRTEKPASYARWFGWRERERRLRRDPIAQLAFLKLQMRYVLFGKEPSPSETLALTMRFVRKSA